MASWASDPEMEIRRTANAGVLLKLDDVTILLDGVCREGKPYLATPPEERARLTGCWPDVLAFTHEHKDHYDPDFAALFQMQTNGVILGPVGLPGSESVQTPVTIGGVNILPVPSRHIGKAGATVEHTSFLIEGSACVWFLGDASPLQWRETANFPKPDVLIVPYAYAATSSGWETAKRFGAGKVVLLHLPARDRDPYGLWDSVEQTTKAAPGPTLFVPEMGQTLYL